MNSELRVLKRDNSLQTIAFDKILVRVKQLGEQEPKLDIPYTTLVMKIIDQLYDKIPTREIDELTAQHCAVMSTHHPDYGSLASRVVISNHHKNTLPSFYQTMYTVHGYNNSLINQRLLNVIQMNHEEIEATIDYSRDYLIDYFGFKTLEKAYLLKTKEKVMERPQHLWMRVALSIHLDDITSAIETYHLMSQKFFTHATPTLFNAGSDKCQLSSCFLVAMESDSIDGIYNTLKDCAKISKWSGGIGLHISNIRPKSSLIKGTNGTSSGIVPMLKLFNDTARFVNQGGKRNGSFAIYLEPWHPDIEDFLEMKKNHGDEEMRSRDLFYGLWIPDLFMKRVAENGTWSLFCPNECEGLNEQYGEKFESLYIQYETEKRMVKTVNARDIWFRILDSQMETGTPYLLYKDAVNLKSNQKNLGTIKSSNLCCEVTLFTDKNETAVCNLASIALPSFVTKDKTLDYEKLHDVARVVTANLNRIIDINYYPTEKSKRSNMLHRPIGIGIQGLADTFNLIGISFDSPEAKEINSKLFETIYHGALERSCELSKNRNDGVIVVKQLVELFLKDSKENQLLYDSLESYDSIFDSLDLLKLIVSNTTLNVDDLQLLQKSQSEWKSLHNLQIIKAEVERARLHPHSKTINGSYSSFDGSPTSFGVLQYDLWNKTTDVEKESRYNWKQLKVDIQKWGIRNSTLLSPMPTASTSQILGFNECFEPWTSNIYSRHTLAGEFMVTNKYFVKEMISLGLWNEDMRQNIIKNRGSVQQLHTIVSQDILNKYKTVWELPMKTVIDMSVDRAKFICQSQSLNLWLEDPTYQKLTSMHFYAWKQGLKTGIYYLRRKGKHTAQQFTIEPEAKEETVMPVCEMCMA